RDSVLQARRPPCRTFLRLPVRALSHARVRGRLARRVLHAVWPHAPRYGSTCASRWEKGSIHPTPDARSKHMAAEERERRDLNRDPIPEEPGSHPIGTGIGAVGGAVAGAAAGEAVNPTAEEAFWRENYDKEPYYEQGRTFDDYGPAYRLGLSGRTRYADPW